MGKLMDSTRPPVFAFSRNQKKQKLKVSTRRTHLPLNRHTRICSKHFVRAEGRHSYPNDVPSLSAVYPLKEQQKEASKISFLSLGDEPDFKKGEW